MTTVNHKGTETRMTHGGNLDHEGWMKTVSHRVTNARSTHRGEFGVHPEPKKTPCALGASVSLWFTSVIERRPCAV
jgi:hypothetical protein